MMGVREQDGGCVEREVSGAGVEKIKNKEKKKVKHKQGSFGGKGKEGAVEKRKRPLSKEGKHGEGVDDSRANSEDVKKKCARCPHNRPQRQC